MAKVNGCSAAWGSVAVEVTPPPAPIGVTATYESGRVIVRWSLPQGANVDSFVIDRCDAGCAGSTGTEAGTSTSLWFEDAPPLNRAYVYRVRSRKLDTFSPQSAPDLATTVALTYYPLQAGVTRSEAAMLQQMRAAVDALRYSAGLAPGTYSDAAVAGLAIRTSHVIDLRNALNPARAHFGFVQLSFTDSVLVAGSTKIRTVHFNEIMEGVR